MALIQMSERELRRLRVLIDDLSDDRLTVEAAGTLLGLVRRQVCRLRRAFAAEGPTAMVSRKRGRASNQRLNTQENFGADGISLSLGST
jgi:Homeodomain-like domain